ncbi:LysR family transcriptional regulator [Pseudarthrobacter sp. H2]|uniref:LysR family transcriptional regulator n=1 Tax=Pseudarthrobacter sp. H2 TaxID=3418415 RepID=UPI003CF5B21A
MSELTLRQLEYFVHVLETGSVTAAARSAQVSQAAVSMAIAQLEHALRTPLLIRKRSKGVAATPAGMELASRARQVLGLVGEMEGAVTGQDDLMRGVLRVGCMSALSPRLLPGLVSDFAERFPGVEVSFQEGAAGELQQQMIGGRLDLCLVYRRQTVPGVDLFTLAEVRTRLMLSADHPLAGRESVFLREVESEWAILLDVPPSMERAVAMMAGVGVEPRLRWCSSNAETIRSLVARGMGYSLTNTRPENEFGPADTSVVYRRIADELPQNAIMAVVPEGIRPSRRVREAILFCQEMLANRTE